MDGVYILEADSSSTTKETARTLWNQTHIIVFTAWSPPSKKTTKYYTVASLNSL